MKTIITVLCLFFIWSVSGAEDKTNLLFTLAKFYARSEQYEKACEKLDEILKTDPGNAKAIQLKNGYLKLMTGSGKTLPVTSKSTSEVLTVFEEKMITEKEKKVAEFIGSGNYDAAVTELNEIVKIAPKYPKSYYQLGVISTSLNKPEEALKHFDKCIELEKNNPYSWFYRGVSLHSLGKVSDAYVSMNKSIQLAPQSPFFFNRISQIYMKDGNLDSSEAMLNSLLKIDPKQEDAQITLGKIILYRGNYEKAQNFFKQVSEQNPDNVRYKIYLSYAKARLGQIDEAMNVLGRNEITADSMFYTALGTIQLLQNKRYEGIKSLEKSLSIDQQNPFAGLELADFYVQMADLNKATEYLQAILQYEPYNLKASIALGDVYERQNAHDKAFSVYSAVYPRESNDPLLLERYGQALARQGFYSQAIEVYQKAFSLAADNRKEFIQNEMNRFQSEYYNQVNQAATVEDSSSSSDDDYSF